MSEELRVGLLRARSVEAGRGGGSPPRAGKLERLTTGASESWMSSAREEA